MCYCSFFRMHKHMTKWLVVKFINDKMAHVDIC